MILSERNQVVGLELSKKMRDLKFPQNSSRHWYEVSKSSRGGTKWWTLENVGFMTIINEVPAYTVAEALEMLPKYVCSKNNIVYTLSIRRSDDVGWFIHYDRYTGNGEMILLNCETQEENKTLADVISEMLIWLKENGYLDENK